MNWLKHIFSGTTTADKKLARIRKAFKQYFDGTVELPKMILPKSTDGCFPKTDWMISYILTKDDEGNPRLDFTADHRMTNPRHIRIDHEGNMTHLEMYMESYSYDENIPGDKERSRNEYFEHNRKVTQILVAKGLLDKRYDTIDERLTIFISELQAHCERCQCREFEYYWEIWGVMWYPWFIETTSGESLSFTATDISPGDLEKLADEGYIELVNVYESLPDNDQLDKKRYRLIKQ